MAIVKLNLSGHKNEPLENDGFKTYALQVDLADPELPSKVVSFLSPFVTSEDIVHLCPPGLAGLTAIVMVALHGLTGTFPTIVLLKREESGFVPAAQHDLQEFRNSVARTQRENIVQL